MSVLVKANIDAKIATHAALVNTHGVAGTIAGLADIVAHAALATGIHGVGALNIAGFHSAGQEVSKVIWKDGSETAMSDDNRTEDLIPTDLDMTPYTSANAKFAIVRLEMRADTIGTGNYCELRIRKNGTSPAHVPMLILDKAQVTAAVWHYQVVIIGLDEDGLIEYFINPGTGWQVDSDIRVLGYIE